MVPHKITFQDEASQLSVVPEDFFQKKFEELKSADNDFDPKTHVRYEEINKKVSEFRKRGKFDRLI